MYISMDKNNLPNWLIKMMAENGSMSQTELAHRSGLSKQAISVLIKGGSDPLVSTLISLSKGLKIPPEKLFREAGIFPGVAVNKEQKEELIYLFDKFPEEEKEDLLTYMRIKLMMFEDERIKKEKKASK